MLGWSIGDLSALSALSSKLKEMDVEMVGLSEENSSCFRDSIECEPDLRRELRGSGGLNKAAAAEEDDDDDDVEEEKEIEEAAVTVGVGFEFSLFLLSFTS
jgi:hypothetical protein